MTNVGRAVEKDETQGFMKILVDAKTHEILGPAILGNGGDEAIHSIRDVMYARAPYTVIQSAAHVHPAVSGLHPYDAWRTAAALKWGVNASRAKVSAGHQFSDIGHLNHAGQPGRFHAKSLRPRRLQDFGRSGETWPGACVTVFAKS